MDDCVHGGTRCINLPFFVAVWREENVPSDRVDNVTRHFLFTYALRGKGYGEGEKWMRRDFGVVVGELGSVNCGDRKRGGRGLNGEL